MIARRISGIGLTALAVLIGSALLVAPEAWSDKKKGKEEKEMPAAEMAKAAKVTVDQAIKTASERVAGTVIEAELETKHDTLVWEVEVVGADGKVTEVHIDAASGAVIDTEEKKPEHEKKRARKREHKKAD